MRLAIVVAAAGGIVAAALTAMFASALPTKDHDLSVDALKDTQTLYTNTRIIVKNTGRLPVTDLLVDYGGGSKEPLVKVLQPGETMEFSPPEGAPLDHVTVTAQPSIMIVQSYRSPIKLPGMMGS